MSIELKVPSAGESITEVTIVEWLKGEGSTVSVDETVALIETDKANVELPAPAAGVITKVLKPAGEVVNVGDVIGYMEAGDAAAAPKVEAKKEAKGKAKAKAPEPEPAPEKGDGVAAPPPLLTQLPGRAQEEPPAPAPKAAAPEAPAPKRAGAIDVAQHLPPRTEVTVDVSLSHRERALYEDARLAAIAELEQTDAVEQTRYHLKVFAALTHLRQLACHPRLVDPRSRVPSAKLERVLQVVEDLVAEGRRALVFSQFVKHLDLLRESLDERGVPYAYLDGATPAAQRAKVVDRFQQGDLPLFLISLKAGGTGLNLTAADTVLHLDPWWNPAVEDQATDRAHRLGQRYPVTVMRFVARDTLEALMLDMNREKRALFSELLDGTEQAGKLSAAELMALIRG
ncbi:MAG: hypothetical protein KC933_04170 [Myxococcales bacterium]|nr:hypothetical protein [Myxococcales bacterium]